MDPEGFEPPPRNCKSRMLPLTPWALIKLIKFFKELKF